MVGLRRRGVAPMFNANSTQRVCPQVRRPYAPPVRAVTLAFGRVTQVSVIVRVKFALMFTAKTFVGQRRATRLAAWAGRSKGQ